MQIEKAAAGRNGASLYDPHNEHDACGVGFIAQINGRKSHKIIREAIRALCNLEHRGAIGGDMKTGDGAGILFQIPHRFFSRATTFNLPSAGSYGVGFLFLPQQQAECERARQLTETVLHDHGASLLGWRQVPVEPECLGEQARREMPSIWQVFLKVPAEAHELERRLYVLRRSLENAAAKAGWEANQF